MKSETKSTLGQSLTALTVSFIMLIASVGYFAYNYNNELKREKAELLEISQLEAKINQQIGKGRNLRSDNLEEATGLDLERKSKDDAIFLKFIKPAVNWKNGEEYAANREKIQKTYGLSDDTQFMSKFMGGEKQGLWRTDPSGKKFFLYPKLNASFNSLETYVTGIDGLNYNYVAIVRFTVHGGKDNKGSATNPNIISYTVDNNGKLSNITAYAGIVNTYIQGK